MGNEPLHSSSYRYRRRRLARALLAAATALGGGSVALAALGGPAAHAASTTSSGASTGTASTIWVANDLANTVTAYQYPQQGGLLDLAPSAAITATGTPPSLDLPLFAALDPSNQGVWVTNQDGGTSGGGSVVEYSSTDLASGATVPLKTINGTNGSLDNATGLAFSGGDLFVTDHNNNQVVMYSSAQLSALQSGQGANAIQPNLTITVNAPAQADLTSTAAPFDAPQDVAFDSSGNMWVLNEDDLSNPNVVGAGQGAGYIQEFPAKELQGLSGPTATLTPSLTITAPPAVSGAPTPLSFPKALAFVGGDLWVVSDAGGSSGGTLAQYTAQQLSAAASASGVQQLAPQKLFENTTFTANGSTYDSISSPNELYWDPSSGTAGTLWLADYCAASPTCASASTPSAGSVVGFSAADLSGSGPALTPSDMIAGPTSNVQNPVGVVVIPSAASAPSGGTITLSVDAHTVNAGTTVTYTAQVSPSTATGAVTFTDNGSPANCGTAGQVALSGGEATCAVAYASAGAHTVTATYAGASPSAKSVTVDVLNGSGGTTTPPPSGGGSGGGGTLAPVVPSAGTTGSGSSTSTTPPSPSPLVAPTPLGLAVSALGIPVSATALADAAAFATTVAGANSYQLTVPAGVLASGSSVSLYSVTNGVNLAPRLPRGEGYLGAFAVTWVAPSGASTIASGTVDATVHNRAIEPGDVVYTLDSGVLKKVAVARQRGQVDVGFTTASTFVLAQPARLLAPLASASLQGNAIQVRLSCRTGSACAASGNLTVMRSVMRHGKRVLQPVVLAHLHRVVLRRGASRRVGFPLTAAGRATLGGHRASFRLGLVLTVTGGTRMVRTVVIH